MSKFERLTFEDRKLLESLKSSSLSANELAAKIGRRKNVVNVEYRRAGGRIFYDAVKAQEESEDRKKRQEGSYELRETYSLEKYKDSIKKLLDEGKSFWSIKVALGINHAMLSRLFKMMNLKNPSVYSLLESFESRLDAMEGALKFLTEKLLK